MSVLFDEAVEALGWANKLPAEIRELIIEQFVNSFPILTQGCGKIDWAKIKNKVTLENIEELRFHSTLRLDSLCYIIWGDMNYPVLETSLKRVINAFDDIEVVSFDTWIYIPDTNNVIEQTFGSLKMTNH